MRFQKGAAVLVAAAMSLTMATACTSSGAQSTSGSETAASSQASANTLKQPTDFTIDAATGQYTFNAVDENAGYYYVRVYALRDGRESGDMVAASERISGAVGEKSGTIDLSGLSYGEYHVNLMTYAAAGTDYESPDAVTTTVKSGVGGTLEKPEMLVMASGNQVEFVLDWWTLCDWNSLQYMPKVKFTIYSDEALTKVVKEETVDTHDLLDTMKKNPPGTGYIWGEARDASVVRWHESTKPKTSMFGGETGSESWKIGFVYNNYAYTLDAGTYYVTAQAISDYDFVNDSKASDPVSFTLTSADPSAEHTEATTSLWEDPDFDGSSVTATPGSKADRVDEPTTQTTTREAA